MKTKIINLLTIFFVCTHVFPQVSYIDYTSPFHPTVNKSGMVVSQNIESSNIGIEILNMGGNAIDAAVAVGFSLAITLPRAGNLGGGGFMLVYIKEKNEIFSIDYRSKSPLRSNLKEIFNANLPQDYNSINRDLVKYGYKANAVPGTVAGLLSAHKEFGKLPLEQILQPVIEQAINGIKVSYDLHEAIKSIPQLLEDKESKNIYFQEGYPLPIGSIMKRKDLANTIQLIAKNGTAGFYQGEVAEKFDQAMQNNNGFISKDDLKEYTVNFQVPISILYRGNKIYTQGPPSGGGITLLTALNILETYNLKKLRSDSTITYHLIAEALRRGHNNRSHYVGDPSFYEVPIEKLLSIKRTKELKKNLRFKKATPSSKVKPFEVINESKDTTHFSIIDKDGNAVSNTYTLGHSFGSGVTIPGTGVLMNNQMNNFALQYGDSSIKGRSASLANKFMPGKRPMSTMDPVMVFNKNGELSLITGSPGGSFIPAAVLRVITGVIDFELDIGEATMLPRIHKDWPEGGLEYESTMNSSIAKQLNKIGHKMEKSKTMGSTQSIHIIDQMNYGYSDLRRPNAGVAIQID
jgi:gamma-glutamyltranspeptidase/glutathione hydrolase